jgi:hypothetical protein
MKHVGQVIVHASPSSVEQRMGDWTQGVIEPIGDDRCRVRIAARSPHDIAFWLGALDVDFEVEDSPELADAVRRIAHRYASAAG